MAGPATRNALAAVSAVVTISTTTRTLEKSDVVGYLRFTNAAASTVTVPTNANVAFEVGDEVEIRRVGAGNLTIAAAGGVTLNAPSGGTLVLTARMAVLLKKIGADEWDVVGQTVPV